MKYYYHVTSIKNLKRIKAKGLINDGEGIFLIDTDDLFVIQHISFTQIFCREVCVLRINAKGITGKICHDNVAEITKRHQFYIKQKRIKPEFIEVHVEFKLNDEDLIDFKMKDNEICGIKMSRNEVREEIEYLRKMNALLSEGKIKISDLNKH
ncbi:MAG: hypothetical protein NTV31_10275 [Bacteroidia bacterium]|nr:hypothetical protein [Bacteroidia bacterium]